MVAVAVAADVELPDDLYLDGAARLVASGLHLWALDAARYLRDPGSARGECGAAWRLIERRPEGCPLVVMAADLTGMTEAEVWRGLCQTAVAQAGLPGVPAIRGE